MRYLAPLVVAVAAAAGLAAQDQQRPIFRSDAHFVTVDAYPLRDGKTVEGLTVDDFVIEEDGRRQTIESFEYIGGTSALPEISRTDPNTVAESRLLAADARSRAFVLYLDVEHVTLAGANASRAPMVRMLNQLVGERDLIALTSSDAPPTAVTFGRRTLGIEDMLTRDWKWGVRDQNRKTALEAELEQCFPADLNGEEGWVRDGQAVRELHRVLRDRAREEAVLTHLEDTVIYLGSLREGRTTVVLFTEGWRLFRSDSSLIGYKGRRNPSCDAYLTRYGYMDNQQRLRDIIAQANRRNVTFFSVNPSGLATFDYDISERVLSTGDITQSPIAQGMDNIRDRQSSMRELADNTDGLAVITNDLRNGLQRVTDVMRGYYLLGYYSTNTAFDGKLRRIKVTVTQPDVDVTARRGYVAPTEAERAARAAALANPDVPAGPSLLETALSALARIRPSTELYAVATLVGERLTATAEMGATAAVREALSADAVLEITATGPDGADLGVTEVPLTRVMRAAEATMSVPASLADVTVSARVRTAGGTFTAKVPTSQDQGPVFGAPLLYRATSSARSPLVPVASQQYRRTERVRVELPVGGALDSREATLVGRDGQPMQVTITLTEVERNGRQVLAVDALLAPLAPGDYVLEVTGAASGQSETRHIAIRVMS